MRWLSVLLIILTTALPAVAEDWVTADGKTYRNVVVIEQENDGVRITYTGGVGIIPYYELPLDLQKRFGEDYDSLEAKRVAAAKALAEATERAKEAAEQKKIQDAAAAAALAAQQQANPPPVVQPKPRPAPVPPPPPVPQIATESNPVPASASVEGADQYPGSRLSYDDGQDVCYLDSPVVDLFLISLDAAPGSGGAPGTDASLTLRISTEGRRPESPDRIEGQFYSGGNAAKIPTNHKIKFVVDGTSLPVHEMGDPNGDAVPTLPQGPNRLSFYITPEQLHAIFAGKKVNFTVGSNDYRIDETGMGIFRKYLADVDHLPPASTNFVRAYHHLLDRLPSIVSVISTVCEYIILGSFALLVAASVAAFVMGMSRFMNM